MDRKATTFTCMYTLSSILQTILVPVKRRYILFFAYGFMFIFFTQDSIIVFLSRRLFESLSCSFSFVAYILDTQKLIFRETVN